MLRSVFLDVKDNMLMPIQNLVLSAGAPGFLAPLTVFR